MRFKVLPLLLLLLYLTLGVSLQISFPCEAHCNRYTKQ